MDDIKTVQDNAVLSRLAMQVTLILDVERILPDCIRRRFGILYGLMLKIVKYLKTKAIYEFASLFHKCLYYNLGCWDYIPYAGSLWKSKQFILIRKGGLFTTFWLKETIWQESQKELCKNTIPRYLQVIFFSCKEISVKELFFHKHW